MSGKYDYLPRAVRAQAEASDKALEDWKKQREEEDALVLDTDSPEEDTVEPTVEETSEAAPEATPEDGNDKAEEGFDWKAEADAMREERDKAVAGYKTLKGKYDAELPRLQAENRTLKEEIETLKAAPAAEDAAPAASDVDLEALRADYGDGIVDAMIAMQKSTQAAPAGAAADPELAARLEKLEHEKNLDAEDAMYSAIEKEHSDWEEVDKLATWHKFLAEVDPNTGETRQAALNRASSRLDAAPIIRQLSAFKRRTKKGDTRLESQVVPGDDGRAEPAPAADTRIYKQSAINAFYKKQAARASQGKPVTEEHSRLDTLYTRAMVEGRVQQS
jgi:hypothetical protein